MNTIDLSCESIEAEIATSNIIECPDVTLASDDGNYNKAHKVILNDADPKPSKEPEAKKKTDSELEEIMKAIDGIKTIFSEHLNRATTNNQTIERLSNEKNIYQIKQGIYVTSVNILLVT